MAKLVQFVAGIVGAAALSAPFVCAQDGRALFTPITRNEVWQAVTRELRQRGVGAEQMLGIEEIELPVTVPAAVGRTLYVSMVCWDAELGRAQFQLECREPGHCIPFLAYAGAGHSTAMGPGKMPASSCRTPPRPRAAPRKATVRAGDHATLVFLGSRLRVTAPVTCLERGGEGEVIRVRNQDGRVFRARISAPGLVEALPQ
jgi:hypothetical protein